MIKILTISYENYKTMNQEPLLIKWEITQDDMKVHHNEKFKNQWGK